jgi:hypothetical protein
VGAAASLPVLNSGNTLKTSSVYFTLPKGAELLRLQAAGALVYAETLFCGTFLQPLKCFADN